MDFEKRISKKALKCAGAWSASEDPKVSTHKKINKILVGGMVDVL